MFIPDFKVTGAETERAVGETVTVNCAEDHQIFTRDLWDDDESDNTLTFTCKPDKDFDVPPTSELPYCWAKCPAQKPQPAAGDGLVLDTNRTSETEEVWQGEEIWYKYVDFLFPSPFLP